MENNREEKWWLICYKDNDENIKTKQISKETSKDALIEFHSNFAYPLCNTILSITDITECWEEIY